MIGETVSHYCILGTLGCGGMGIVYKAEYLRRGRLVPMTFLTTNFCSDRQATEQFGQEARTASRLNHPSICTIHDIDEYRGQPFIVMEFLEGSTLRELLRNGRFRSEEAIAFGIQIADALAKAHAKGIVHCDITPANLFVTEEGRIKLLDFGIAQLMQDRTIEPSAVDVEAARPTLTGTVRYMSPEQALGRNMDARSDIFSFGVVLYEMLTGRLPFMGADFPETIEEIVNAEPAPVRTVNPIICAAVEKIVSRCLEKSPERRYQSAGELQKELMQAVIALRAVSELSVV